MARYSDYKCTGNHPNLCITLSSKTLCDTYTAQSVQYGGTGQCSWNDTLDICENSPPTSCELYYDIMQACPQPCDLDVIVDKDFEGIPTYRIYKDLPNDNSFGQYYFSNNYDKFVSDTGISTATDIDDLYSTMDSSNQIFSNETIDLPFTWDDNTAINFEMRSLMWAWPNDMNPELFILALEYRKAMWVIVSTESEWDNITSYSSADTFLSAHPKFYYLSYNPSSSFVIGDNSCPQDGIGPDIGAMARVSGASLSGWGISSWYGQNNLPDIDDVTWVYDNPQDLMDWSEFGWTDGILSKIDTGIISNLFDPIENWEEFIQNPEAIIVVGQYSKFDGYKDLNGNIQYTNRSFGLSKISSVDFKNAILSGQDTTFDISMDKRYTSGDVEVEDLCGYGYNVTDTDGGTFNPWFMECTGWVEDKSTCFTRIHFEIPDPQAFGEVFAYNFYYNLGGRKINDLLNEKYMIYQPETTGGYNIKYNDSSDWSGSGDEILQELSGTQILPDQIYDSWRPIPHVFIGDTETPEDGIYVQKYFDFLDPESPYASAPNVVNLNMYIAEDDGLNVTSYVSYYDKVLEKLKESVGLGEGNPVMTSYSGPSGTAQEYMDIGDYTPPNTTSRIVPPECCVEGPGYVIQICSGGQQIGFENNCNTGAEWMGTLTTPCYGNNQYSCTCTADCAAYGYDNTPIYGCMDPDALNYNENADFTYPTACIYFIDEGNIPIGDFLQEHFEFEFYQGTDSELPYCSNSAGNNECSVDKPITFEIDVKKADYEDFILSIVEYIEYLDGFPSSADWGSYDDGTPMGGPWFKLEIDLGNGAVPVRFPIPGNEGVYDEKFELPEDGILEFRLDPGGNDYCDHHYSDFMFLGTDNEYFNNDKPGGINWQFPAGNIQTYNFYPRVFFSSILSDPDQYPIKDVWQGDIDISLVSQFYQTRLTDYGNGSQSESGPFIIYHPGCTDAEGDQYNAYAHPDDGSCTYNNIGCMDVNAINYNENATSDDGSCLYFSEEFGFDINPIEASIMSEEVYEILTTETGTELPNIDYFQKLKMFVVNWDFDSSTDVDIDDLVFPSDEPTLEFERLINDTFKEVDVFDISENGKVNFLQHQYNEPGVKVIKAVVMSVITNDIGDELPLVIKTLTIKINLTLDSVYIEDFAETGGPDFKFLPFSSTSPVISGVSDSSRYITSLNTIFNGGQFKEEDVLDKINLERALLNDEMGEYIGSSAIEQVRYFKNGSLDMGKLLGIESFYENYINDKGDNSFYKYDKYGFWNGTSVKYPEETSIGSIFIDDATYPSNIRRECLIELNLGESDGRVVIDTSGNGNKGILIGDYKLSKPSIDIPIRRETQMKLPKIIDDDDKAL